MSLPKRGGCPLSYALYIAKGCSVASSITPKGQKVAKVNFFLLALVFSRDFRRQKRAKTKYILKVGAGRAVLVVGCLPAFIVSTCAGLPAFEGAGPARGGLWSFGRVFPPFVRFPVGVPSYSRQHPTCPVHIIRAKHPQKWQKLTFICLAWCFLGIFRDKKGQNLRYI